MNTKGRLKKFVMLALATILLIVALPSAATASPAKTIDFYIVAGLGGFPGPWSSSGLVTSSGTANFDPFFAGWDSVLAIPATIHDTFVLTDEHGSITFKGQAKSAIVSDNNGDPVRGYELRWVIISATGAYTNLHGRGDGHAWPDFTSGTFPIYLSGRAHYEPQQ